MTPAQEARLARRCDAWLLTVMTPAQEARLARRCDAWLTWLRFHTCVPTTGDHPARTAELLEDFEAAHRRAYEAGYADGFTDAKNEEGK